MKPIITTSLLFLIVLTAGCQLPTESNSKNNNADVVSDNENDNLIDAAIEAKEGNVYTSNTRVKLSDLGMSIIIPKNWQGERDIDAFHMSSNDSYGKAIIQQDNRNAEQSMQFLENTIELGNGMYLQPLSKVLQSGTYLSAHYELYGTDIPSLGYIVKILGTDGPGLIFIFYVESNTQEKFDFPKITAKEVTDTLLYTRTSTDTEGTKEVTENTDEQDYYAQKIIFKEYSFSSTALLMSPGGVVSTAFDILFCDNDDFIITEKNRVSFSNGMSYQDNEYKYGAWLTTGGNGNGSLTLKFDSGETQIFKLSIIDENISLDDRDSYYVIESSC